jgi:hypothetical protein
MMTNKKSVLLITLASLFLALPAALKAQSNSPCFKIYVWDFADKDGKKLTDQSISEDFEQAFASESECKLVTKKTSPEIAVAIKNERLSQLPDKISELLSKKFVENGIQRVLLAKVNESPASNKIEIGIRIIDLSDKHTAYSGNFFISREEYYGNKEKRNLKIKEFVGREILKKETGITKGYYYGAGTVVGAGGLAYGLLGALSIKSDWQAYQLTSPTDVNNRYNTDNSNYKTKQYFAIGGAVLAATCGYLWWKSTHNKDIAKAKTISLNTPQTTPHILFEPTNAPDGLVGFGIALKF